MDSSAHAGADRGSQSKTSHLIYTLVSVFVWVYMCLYLPWVEEEEQLGSKEG